MNESQKTNIIGYWKKAGSSLRILGGLALLAAAAPLASATDNRAPEVPFQIAITNATVHFVGHAIGFQIYTWNGASWGPATPAATLYDDDGNVVILHFGTPNGPGWQSNSGSEVIGKLPPAAVVVDTNSIPWLRLEANPDLTHGPGVLANTVFIHRVHTVGGKSPRENGTFIGQVAKIPYTADYFFYRDSNN